MTREEAADMIRNDMRLHHDALSGTYRKALNMAIEALQEQKTGHWITQAGLTMNDVCSNCGSIGRWTDKYCSGCGARMRGDE